MASTKWLGTKSSPVWSGHSRLLVTGLILQRPGQNSQQSYPWVHKLLLCTVQHQERIPRQEREREGASLAGQAVGSLQEAVLAHRHKLLHRALEDGSHSLDPALHTTPWVFQNLQAAKAALQSRRPQNWSLPC